MTRALLYEWVRIRTIRSTYWMSALAIGLTIGIASLLVWGINVTPRTDMSIPEVTTWVVTGGASSVLIPVLAGVFFAVMGAMAMGHEYRYGTNKATLTALPDRVAVFAAKALMLTAWVVASLVVILVVDLVIAGVFLHSYSLSGSAIRPMLSYVAYCVGFALAGMSLSAIFRNQTGAIVAVLVWPLVIEPIITGVLLVLAHTGNEAIAKLANLLPASAGRRMVFSPYDAFAGFGQQDTWGLAASVLVFWAGVLILLGLGLTSFLRRDA